MRIELEHRGRLYDVAGATVKPISPNTFEVTLPRDDQAVQRSRRPWTLEGWDGASLVLDERDAEPAIASGIDDKAVRLTVFIV